MKIGIGNDHAAVEMKMQIMEYMESLGHEVVNYGVDTPERCDYPVIGEKVGKAVASGEVDCAVLIAELFAVGLAVTAVIAIAMICHKEKDEDEDEDDWPLRRVSGSKGDDFYRIEFKKSYDVSRETSPASSNWY